MVKRKCRRDSGGYSLFELLGTLGLFAIVLTLGVPSISDIVVNQKLTTEVNALFHAIHFARKSSIVRRRVVTLCPTADGASCLPTTDWSGGWMIFVNLDRDWPANRDPDEPVLHHNPVTSDIRIVANRRSFSLRSTDLRATNGTLIFCDSSNRGTSRALVVSYTGRPRVARKDRRGNAYRCLD